ncbi:hypothetical protein K491DRAFT_601332 [Lophiostoma macrostomum CBS 122681]|uniref:Fungal N-terminal domain-containing protein n=1 Tax=Lophiostoma macrostomum CBS 122681 TaxID=1314788 RepID=A0A6A6T4I5_9PLEO|nr:hypothetical protein K491DRAFT_601332 [Lophiostoma macrostomum CBS 122681]
MSFGFSAGDFLAAGKLVHDVIQSLQDVGGAKSDYQEIIRELYSLNKALRHLDGLQSDSSGQDRTFQSIKFAALSCRRPLEQFLAKSKKFDSTLDVRAKTQTTKSVFRKLQWGLGMKSEVTKLQGYLNLHVSTINILLSEHSLERLSLVQNRIDTETFQLREKLDAAEGVIGRIDQNVADQMALIQNTQTATRSMLNLICGDFRTSWRSLGQMIAQICVSMQQIYGVVLEIKASNTPIDIRHTWFQTPLLCEDALGIKFPIPSEWDYGMVASHIRYRFREGIGSRIFLEGHWDLFQTRDSKELIRESTRLLPGLEVTMALIVLPLLSINNSCPVLGCASTETVPTQGESRLW